MSIFRRSLLVLMLFLQINPVFSSSYRKIDYTVEIYNYCKNCISNFNIQYDGKSIFPIEGGRNFGSYYTDIYTMPLTIPDVARVTWMDFKGVPYEELVPLRSLIRLRDYFGREFRINFHVCNDELHVIFGKRSHAQIEYKLKEIWNNQNDKASLSGKAA